jgi:hypothetical protein
MNGVCLAQGAYFAITGIWPLVSLRTFEAVTGPKVDAWLVKTVGVLVAVVGAVLILSGVRGDTPVEVVALGVASALALAGVDAWYVGRRVIPPIYLLDAALELALVAAWGLAWLARR